MACEQQQPKACSSNIHLQAMKVSCKQHPDYALGIREGKVKMLSLDINDQTQRWERVPVPSAVRTDFMLVNKATRQAIAHPNAEKEEVYLIPLNPNCVNKDTVWNQPLLDVGSDYRAVRSASNTALNMDLFGGVVGDCSRIGMWKWHAGENQLWKISQFPIGPCPFP